MSQEAPWRRPPRDHFPGVPAWGAASASLALEEFAASQVPYVTGDWAWGGSDGSGVRVAVLDSGVDGSHPRIRSLVRSVSVVPGPGGEIGISDCAPVDTAGHGTACAGLISSIAPGAALVSVKVLTDSKYGSGADLLAGLEWAIDQEFDVINMSLSTASNKFILTLRELADRAYFRRSVLVTSAHNMPVKSYPWPFSSVISVASHDEPDSTLYYYNPAPPVDFFARGLRVSVAWPGGKEIRSTGNSFATPHITGLCALILSKHPTLTPFQLKSVLYLAAKNVSRIAGGEHASARGNK
jgi:subtilisin family serine protease